VKFDAVIWDWNGTLLNDVVVVVETINQLLSDRKLPQLTVAKYLEVFTFPVRDYYSKIGFDFQNEPFEIPALQFITIYNEVVTLCGLYDEVVPVLTGFQNRGIRQFILSAMEQNQLVKTVSDNGISHFFDDLYGLDNHYAHSKVDNGKLLIRNNDLNPDHTLLVGDTIHDYEVAQTIGCSCILIANGHQSKARLLSTGARVVDNLNQIEFS
jgi:phosphoglycolate phosphatase